MDKSASFNGKASGCGSSDREALSMRTPLRVGLATASGVFLAALLAGLFHGDSINGHILTPLEELPLALILALFASVCALIGTWLGMRGNNLQHLICRSGLAVTLASTWNLFCGHTPFGGAA